MESFAKVEGKTDPGGFAFSFHDELCFLMIWSATGEMQP